MIKKFAALLCLLVCISATSVAQKKVATAPTAYADLDANTEYAILVKSDKTATDGSGNLLYCDGSNLYVDCRTKSNNLGSTLSSSQYYFKVEKQSDGVRIKSVSANKYWRNDNGKSWPSTSQSNLDKLGMGDAKTLNVVTSGNGIKVYYTYKSWGKTYTQYLVNNSASGYNADTDDTFIGTYEKASDASNTAVFEFYALSPTITYNYQWKGETKLSVTHDAIEGEPYPDPTGLPDFVEADKPSGNYTASAGTSFNVPCYFIDEAPFKISTDNEKVYYYLGTDGDNPTLITRSGNDVAFRAKSETNPTLNDVVNDLWYITGDPFDGFYFNNVGKGKAQSYYDVDGTAGFGSLSYLCVSGGLLNSTDKWKIAKTSDNSTTGFIIYPHDRGTNRCWRYNGSDIKFQLDDSYPNAFAVYEPTITLPLNVSAADMNYSFATSCLPYAVESVTEGAYTCVGAFEDGKVELYSQSAIPANEGFVIVDVEGASSITLKVIAEATTDVDNELKGTTTELTNLTDVLSFGRANLSDGSKGKVGFFKSTNSTLKANRAYIINPTAQSMAISFGGNNITGIDNATDESANTNAPIYDLTGRRVNQVVKGGIYIQSGRKFMAR